MTYEEKAEEYATEQMKSYLTLDDYSYGVLKLKITEAHFDGLAEGRKNCMTVQNAMETIKRYCKEITDENKNCLKCIFCSKGFNGCKLQRAPCEWE